MWKDRGQDLFEYAVMGVLVVVAAGCLMPATAAMIGNIFSDVVIALTAW
jgi:hypothetical protein